MKIRMFQIGTLLGLILLILGCQPPKKQMTSSSTTFRDIKTVYQLDSTGTQVARQMYLSFTCLLDGATDSKWTEMAFYQEAASEKSTNSYFELREVTMNSDRNSNYTVRDLLIVDNLSISNLSIVSLFVGKESKLLGTQTNIKALPQLGGKFLEYNRQTGIGLFSAMSTDDIPANMKCNSIRVP